MSMPNSQRYPLNLYLINIVEDFVVFLGLYEFTSDSLVFKTMNKNILFSTWPDNTFKGTVVVNQVLPS